jgi:hypothetical protein
MATAYRRRRRYVETTEFLAAVGRLVRSGGRRVALEDPDQLVALLELQHQVDLAIIEAVAGLRAAGITWEDIGAAAGTTRQAALMRWGPKIAAVS